MANRYFSTSWIDDISKSLKSEQNEESKSAAESSMSNPISHDRAYAQRHVSTHRREHSRKRSRIEDETYLIPAAELPAESPRLTPIDLPARSPTIKFETSYKKRRRVRRSADGSTNSILGSTESESRDELEYSIRPLTGHGRRNDDIETKTSHDGG